MPNYYFLSSKLAFFLLIAAVMSPVARAADTIELRFRFMDTKEKEGEEKSTTYDSDIIRSLKTLNYMIEDLGGYSSKINATIPLHNVLSSSFNMIIHHLSVAKDELQTDAIDKVEPDKLKEALQKSLLTSWPTEDSSKKRLLANFILSLIAAAHYLDVPVIMDVWLQNWIETFSDSGSNFNYLNKDLKRDFISKLKPSGFIKLMEANESKQVSDQQIDNEEISFKIALKVHYQEEPISGDTAKGLYKRIYSAIKVGRQPGALALSGSNLYVGNYGSNNVKVIDIKKNEVIATIGSTGPQALAISGSKLFVANVIGTVSVINTINNQKIGQPIPVGRDPRAFAISKQNLFVVNTVANSLSIIDTSSNQVIGNAIPVGDSPWALALSGSKIYVANMGDDTITVIDIENNRNIGEPIKVGSTPTSLAVSGSKLYVGIRGGITVIDTKTDLIIGELIRTGRHPRALAVAGPKLYVADSFDATITAIDTYNDQIVSRIRVGKAPKAIVVSGSKLYVANGDDTVMVIDLDSELQSRFK